MSDHILCRHVSIVRIKGRASCRLVLGTCEDYLLWFEDDKLCYSVAPCGITHRIPITEVASVTFIPTWEVD